MAAKRTPKPDPNQRGDPLGKPLARYGTGLKATLVIIAAVVLGLIGGGVLGGANGLAWSLAESQDGTPYVIVGWALLVVGPGMIAYGVYVLGRSFEVRHKGVRFVNRRNVTEMRWDEIDRFEIHKTIHVDEAGRRTGKVDWEIFIYGFVDEIHLTPAFLQMVPSVISLVSLLKMHSGKEIQLPSDY